MPKRLYFTNLPNTSGFNLHRANRWDDAGSSTSVLLGDVPGGTNVAVSRSEVSTNNAWDVLLVQAVSEPFRRAVTLTGAWTITVPWQESSTAADMRRQNDLYVIPAVGSTARGVLASGGGTNELPTTLTGGALNGTCDPLAVQPGDRLVVEYGYRAINTSDISYTGTTRVGGTATPDLVGGSTAGVTTRPGWVEFADDSFTAAFTAGPSGWWPFFGG